MRPSTKVVATGPFLVVEAPQDMAKESCQEWRNCYEIASTVKDIVNQENYTFVALYNFNALH